MIQCTKYYLGKIYNISLYRFQTNKYISSTRTLTTWLCCDPLLSNLQVPVSIIFLGSTFITAHKYSSTVALQTKHLSVFESIFTGFPEESPFFTFFVFLSLPDKDSLGQQINNVHKMVKRHSSAFILIFQFCSFPETNQRGIVETVLQILAYIINVSNTLNMQACVKDCI